MFTFIAIVVAVFVGGFGGYTYGSRVKAAAVADAQKVAGAVGSAAKKL